MPTMEEKIADLERQIAAQKEELARLRGEPHKRVGEAWQPIDWTARMSAPPSVIAEMARAVPNSVISGIVGDARRAAEATQSRPGPEPVRGSGWADEVKIKPPPGIELMDRGMDVQDATDRQALIDEAIRRKLK